MILAFLLAGMNGQAFADVNKALDERTIGHNPERLCLMKVSLDPLLMRLGLSVDDWRVQVVLSSRAFP